MTIEWMNKVLQTAAEAVALVPDGATIMMGGFGVCGMPENLDRRPARAGHARPHHHQQQRRPRRLRRRPAAGGPPGAEDDLDLRRREQGIRAAVPERRARGRSRSAGYVVRADSRGRRRHRRVLHADGIRDARRRGQGNARDRRQELRVRVAAARRLRVRAGVERRPRWAISSTGRRRGTSTRSWPPPAA